MGLPAGMLGITPQVVPCVLDAYIRLLMTASFAKLRLLAREQTIPIGGT